MESTSKVRVLRQLILGNSTLLLMVGAIALLITLILFQLASRKKNGLFLEKSFAVLYIFIAPHLTQVPFNYLHFNNLEDLGKGAMTMLPIFFYPWALIILFSRIRIFLQNIINYFAKVMILNPFFMIYLLFPLTSTLWSTVPDITFKAGLSFSLFTIFGFYIGSRYQWEDLSRFLRWGYTAIGIGSFLLKPPRGGDFMGLTLSKNSLGGIVALCTAFWYLHYTQGAKTKRERWIALGLMFFSFYLVRMNKSGSALVVTLMLIITISSLSFLKKLSFQWAFTAIICFLAVSIIASVYLAENVESIVVEGLGKDLTLTGRTEFWPKLIEAANERPWFGYGFLGFFQQDILGPETPAFFIWTSTGFQPKTAHNGALATLLHFGWPGMILLLISLVLNLVYAVRYLSRSRLDECGVPICFLVFIILNNITEGSIADVGDVWLSYVFLSVRLAIDNIDKPSPSSTPQLSQGSNFGRINDPQIG